MGNIDWLPIAELPEALKDGRDVLLHEFGRSYLAWHNEILGWVTMGEYQIEHPSHFAEVNGPE